MIINDIAQAARLLQMDELVAIPTETVYGLAGNAFSDQAVRKIFSCKQRPFSNPLIVHIPSVLSLSEVAMDIPDSALRLAFRFWPGPLTLVLRKNGRIPQIVTAGNSTIAVRVPDHPVTLELLNRVSFPLAAPSANPFGRISPTTARHVEDYFGDSIGCVLEGGSCAMGLESTIVGFPDNKPVLYRLGALTEDEIRSICPDLLVDTGVKGKPPAPGMFDRHYSPRTPMRLISSVSEWQQEGMPSEVGLLAFRDVPNGFQQYPCEVLSNNGDMEEAARNLYAAMLRLDALRLRLIVAETLPDHGHGRAINDRLKRAVADSNGITVLQKSF